MSKLLKSLRADLTNERKYDSSPVSAIRATIETDDPVSYHPQDRMIYWIHAGLDYRIACKEGDEDHMVRNVHHQLRQDIYGDFIEQLLHLERLVHHEVTPSPEMLDAFSKLWRMMNGEL